MKVSFYNIGCKVNFAEMSELQEQFEKLGHTIIPFGDVSDAVLINTCTVTREADADCRKVIRRAQRVSPNAFIGVMGCYAQLRSDEISAIEGVDAIFGNEEKYKIPELIGDFSKRNQLGLYVGKLEQIEFHGACSSDNVNRTRAVLKIQDGCDYVCTYCTIPAARGGSRSMKFDDLRNKLLELNNTDFYEIILSGVNLGEYKSPTNENFTDVIRLIESLDLKLRFRISSIEPNLVKPELLDIVSKSEKMCPHFHIPLQSGSPDILRLMKRRYKLDVFINLVQKIKSNIPDCCIGVDIITGFPGETDSHFLETYNLLSDLPVSYLHVFTYSKRNGTAASEYPDEVPYPVKIERTHKLRELSERKKKEFYLSQLGKIKTVIKETIDESTGLWHGWTENYVKVYFKMNETNPVEKVKLKSYEKDIVIADII
ncbi:MAG: tRNA (N(6)-L-threonylcarbamoyladenosine(37)-C(2))-methylthiotransferase MtaB [Ignavibacteriae bacterium]|nr:tRNA (N(6)-L-threonylcarbamoyladenosine(37)-C(2))-methylthiotransferase MtaB [Ignavibacteriota bacterium]